MSYEVSNMPNAKDIRQSIGLTQARFAALMGVSVRTLKKWERGNSQPNGMANVLLGLMCAKVD